MIGVKKNSENGGKTLMQASGHYQVEERFLFIDILLIYGTSLNV